MWQPLLFLQPVVFYATFLVALGFTSRWIPGTHLRSILKQPLLMGIILWALAHLCVAMMLHQFLIFFIVLFWSLVAFFRNRHDPVPRAFSWWRDLAAIVFAAVLWYCFAFYGYPMIVGVPAIY